MIQDTPVSVEVQNEAHIALNTSPGILPWKINIVLKSLPYHLERSAAQKALEDCKGDVDLAVSQLLDNQSESSASSRCGSSSVERDHDDEEYSGPKKKQDRRLSRAKRSVKAADDASKQNLSIRTKSPLLSSTQESLTSEAASSTADNEDGDETEEEDWSNISPFKDSETASVSTSASEYSITSNPRAGGIRLKLTQPRNPDQTAGPEAGHPAKQPAACQTEDEEIVPEVKQHLVVPRKRLLTRNQLDTLKKTAQKAAAKERKREIAAQRIAHKQPGSFLPKNLKGRENTPAIENHIKVLYI